MSSEQSQGLLSFDRINGSTPSGCKLIAYATHPFPLKMEASPESKPVLLEITFLLSIIRRPWVPAIHD